MTWVKRLLSAISPVDIYMRVSLRQAERAQEILQRELKAERAENNRLLGEIKKLLDQQPTTRCECSGDIGHWRREADRHARNALRLTDQLAAAEGRPYAESLT